MEIIWYGHSCFRLKTRGAAIVTDPCGKDVGYNVPRLRADILTISYDHPDYSNTSLVQGGPKVISGPGEYEIKGIFVTGLRTYLKKLKDPDKPKNTIYLFDFDGLTICHLGILDHVPPEAQVQPLSSVDVLLIPIGAGPTINANQAAEVIGLLEPKIVVPMHFKTKMVKAKLDPVDKFLKEMGLSEAETRDTLEVDKSHLPAETQVVVLSHRE